MKKRIFAGVALLMLPASSMFAQQPGFKGHSHEPKKNVVKSSNAPKVAERDLADVILAQTLENLNESGDDHFHKGEWNHTINLYRVVVQGDPSRVECYTNSAFLLWSSDRNDQAIAFLKQGIATNPKNYFLLDELAMHYAMNLKQYAEAIPYYERAMKLKPQFYTVHGLARCYERTNQWEKALKTWEIANAMPINAFSPNNPTAEAGIRRSKAKLGMK